jgi:hypothetical protein
MTEFPRVDGRRRMERKGSELEEKRKSKSERRKKNARDGLGLCGGPYQARRLLNPTSAINREVASNISSPPRMSSPKFPEVQGGGSLIVAWQVKSKKVLVVGGGEVSHQIPAGYIIAHEPHR